MTAAEVLQLARANGTLSALDMDFAAAVTRWSGTVGEDAGLLALVGAAVSRRLHMQHVFLDIQRIARDDPFELGDVSMYPAPELLTAALGRARIVNSGDDAATATPLVMVGSRVYLARQFNLERFLALALRARATELPEVSPDSGTADDSPEKIQQLLALLFPDEQTDGSAGDSEQPLNWQRIGAAIALSRRLAVITGGPGTGKTTTVTRLLALLLHARPGLRVALAAPTGKAAARLAESVQASKAQLRGFAAIGAQTLAMIPEQGATLHRLLGYRPIDNTFRYNAQELLPFDVVVIDEASMLDLRMACALLAALAPRARLVLLGDKDQLSSVDAGMVMGDICGGLAEHFEHARFSPAMARQLTALTGYDLQALTAERVPVLADTICWLRVSHRFAADSAIGRLADAINQGAGNDALVALSTATALSATAAGGGALQLVHTGGDALIRSAVHGFAEFVAAARQGDGANALRLLSDFRVLAAVREGRDGVIALNAQIEQALLHAGVLSSLGGYFAGRPLLITVNDHRLGLYNGDVGVVVAAAEGARVAFADGAGGVRLLHPHRLPQHETVFAMTVHKSQGSEFNAVAVVLPRAPSINEKKILTRELLYTAVTRARTRVLLYAEIEVLREAIATPTQRASGLRDALWSH